ncbi:MAG: hypothetical protein ACRD5E_13960 [Nitrososphaeraceae archaeon]
MPKLITGDSVFQENLGAMHACISPTIIKRFFELVDLLFGLCVGLPAHT